MSSESPRHARSGGPLTVPSQPPSDRSIIDAVSGFINDVTLSSSSAVDPKDVIQWARFETADINEPTPEGDSDNDISPLLLILGYGSGVQVWLIPPTGEAQEVLSWRQGTVRVLRILPTPQHGDCFASKRPLIALCDSVSPGPSFCSLSFISIRGGEQVKSIKFKNPILDVLANKRSVVVAFSERFAVFDAATLEDRLAVTTCYPCPCPLGGSAPVNPLALGDRWLAYADKKLNQSKRSSGGCEGEGVTSYTATVLHAAKSLSKGLRGLGESVAHSLAGGRTASQSPSPPNTDVQQPGVVTVLDIEGNDEETQDSEEPYDPIVAHFVAHSEAIIALQFDASGMLLVTADRRGHDFHVFRINPHPCGPSLASVHHLYILHRGDTTAKVQDIAISPDSRWAAISTLRGTTHLFPLSPYGGACGVRTHTSPRVVNRLSRFHRSAGLPIHSPAHTHAAGSPVSDGVSQGAWFPNPRLPPYPLPASLSPLAQLRPTANLPTHTITRTSSGRQRLSSLSEECSQAPLLARARFGPAPGAAGPARAPAAAALYLVAATGCLSHIALHPRPARNVPKEKICDESPIELEVEPIAQWPLQRPAAAADLLAPLPPSNPLLQPLSCRRCADMCMSEEERWLSQVEIVTHAGPHRRLWMGPQFVFKTYNCTGSNSSLSEAETVEVETSASRSVARSNPVNMPGVRPVVPVLIDSGSASSLEHSPSDSFRRKSLLAETGRAASVCDVQLKEDLAEAMKEDHGWRESERGWDTRRAVSTTAATATCVERVVDPLGTVVAPPPATCAPPLDDPDVYTTSNADEATFRPVVRAPAALSLHPDMVVRPLPRSTTIPVQTVSPLATMSPQDEPLPLNTDVVIPAALTTVEGWHSSNQIEDDPEEVLNFSIDIPAEMKISLEIAEPRHMEKAKQEIFITVDNSDVDKTKKYKSHESKSEKVAGVKDVDAVIKAPDLQKTSTKSEETFNVKKELTIVDKHAKKEVEDIIEKQVKHKDKAAKLDKALDKKVVREEIGNKTTEPDSRVVTDVVSKVDRISVDDKKIDVNRDLKLQESDVRKHDSARERSSVECAERKSDDSKSLPKSNRPSDDIQPAAKTRVKKSPTPKSVSDKDSEVSVKDNKFNKTDEAKEIRDLKEVKETKEVKEPKEIKKQKEDRVPKCIKEMSEPMDVPIKPDKSDREVAKVTQIQEVKNFSEILKGTEKESIDYAKDDQSVAVPIKLSTKKELSETKAKRSDEYEIKTEDQAWDMLLSEPEKPVLANVQESSSSADKISEEKSKSKRNRKLKKIQDDTQAKSEDDSFVEIHAIEEKQQPCSDELVSISIPFEDIDCSTSYSSKSKKIRSPKCSTPEKREESERVSIDIVSQEEIESYTPKNLKKYDDISDIEILSEPLMFTNSHKGKKHSDGTASECTSYKEFVKPNKSKSLSPYPENRKLSEKPIEMADKDVYVINTTDDDFPEIQITRGSKPRKRSPQPEKKVIEKEPVIERPIKSWSSIAAGKSAKKFEDVETKLEARFEERKSDVNCKKGDLKEVPIASDDNSVSSTRVSLQDKLIELCKRTDIMVAECDAPSELNFVEEHHGVVPDLPPLEPLDFGLDDFKLEVMRDSLLDVNDTKLTSPICKINIDDILSSIKETTSKVIESSTFNLIDLEKVPAKKERGFSVIETDKITSQEIKIDDDKLDDKEMEKSSDDDVTSSPVVSTDSDKDEKKNTGASTLVLPSLKQSAKSKKSRRKKK